MTSDFDSNPDADSGASADPDDAPDATADPGGANVADRDPEDATGAAPGGGDGARGVNVADRDPEDATGPTEGPAGREVVVPMRLYKTVTVMGTLLAMAGVVGGFVLLDAATNRARAPLGEIDPVLGVAGLGLIVAGATSYALSTRFRAPEMGRSKADEPVGDDDG